MQGEPLGDPGKTSTFHLRISESIHLESMSFLSKQDLGQEIRRHFCSGLGKVCAQAVLPKSSLEGLESGALKSQRLKDLARGPCLTVRTTRTVLVRCCLRPGPARSQEQRNRHKYETGTVGVTAPHATSSRTESGGLSTAPSTSRNETATK